MTNPQYDEDFTSRLLKQDEVLSDSQYKDYRMNLENALGAAERKEKVAGHVAAGSFAVALILMFVGGSSVFGAFDPWSKDATPFSVALGAIYCLASVAWPLALAIGFSRYRPAVGKAKGRIRDAMLLDLQREVRSLRQRIAPDSPPEGPEPPPCPPGGGPAGSTE